MLVSNRSFMSTVCSSRSCVYFMQVDALESVSAFVAFQGSKGVLFLSSSETV